MLYETPVLDADDHRVLAEIEEMRHKLRHQLRTQPRWSGQLRRNLTARAIAGSNTIEGYAATVDDVEALMAGEEPLETADRTRVELEGYQRTMTYIQALADAGPEFRYDAGLLGGLHFMLKDTTWTSAQAAGGTGRCMSPAPTTRSCPPTPPPTSTRFRS